MRVGRVVEGLVIHTGPIDVTSVQESDVTTNLPCPSGCKETLKRAPLPGGLYCPGCGQGWKGD